MYTAEVEVQYATTERLTLTDDEFQQWTSAALLQNKKTALVIRLVDTDESRELNKDYRGKDKPTNVLSFPFEAPEHILQNYLGDLVICARLVRDEALKQNKELKAHFAHLVVHGILHLQGYDHQTEQQRQQMQSLETKILATLGLPDPYKEQ